MPIPASREPTITHDQAEQIAADAISLFLECRDVYGYSEDQSRAQALIEVSEGLAQLAIEQTQRPQSWSRSSPRSHSSDL